MSIEVGDWVMVVRFCCVRFLEGQLIYQVACINSPDEYELDGCCEHCGTYIPAEPNAATNHAEEGLPVSWLKKIDPPSSGELTGVPLRLKEPV